MAEACRQIKAWRQQLGALGIAEPRVCVNLSARQFVRQGLADHVESLLVQSGIPGRQLGLELTESSILDDNGKAAQILLSLRRLGVSLLLDDFGTGYSSLSYLHSLPFDQLKIDRSFVGRMTEGNQPLQIVRTIVELARALGMNAVAEGIETPGQLDLLKQIGCRFGQGFLFARPLPAETITRLLAEPPSPPLNGARPAAPQFA
jgi:EAL domain-containing protein (putative c-di-GMP-specific phosphodiesterase class I)